MAGVLTLNLVLQKSKIDDIRRVRKLNVCASQIQDIGVLHQAVNLEVLSMSLNEISDLGALSSCQLLSEVHLRKNHIRDINQVLHLSRLPYLEVLNLADNPISRDPNYRRFVVAAIPSLERLDDGDITDEERSAALAVFPHLLQFAPPPSKYALPTDGVAPPSIQERQAQARANSTYTGGSGTSAPLSHRPTPDIKRAASTVSGSGMFMDRPPSAANTTASSNNQPSLHKAPPTSSSRDAHHPSGLHAAPPSATPGVRAQTIQRESQAAAAAYESGPSEEGVVQAVKVLCSELTPQALREVRRFIDSL